MAGARLVECGTSSRSPRRLAGAWLALLTRTEARLVHDGSRACAWLVQGLCMAGVTWLVHGWCMAGLGLVHGG